MAVTADHSTPVAFGDHSHEPVPLAIASVADIAGSLGAHTLRSIDLGAIAQLSQHTVVPATEVQAQAERAAERRLAVAAGKAWHQGCWGRMQWVRPGTDCCAGDDVALFDEISAARGALGRFPSSELMPLVRALLAQP